MHQVQIQFLRRRAPLDRIYTNEPYNFRVINAVGREPRVKTFGPLIACNGGALIIGETQYRIQVIAQQQQIPSDAMAGIIAFGNDYIAKKRTIVLSDASVSVGKEVLDMLELPEENLRTMGHSRNLTG